MSAGIKEISEVFLVLVRYYNGPDRVRLAVMAKYKSNSFQLRLPQLHFLTGVLQVLWHFYFRTGTGRQRSNWPNSQVQLVLWPCFNSNLTLLDIIPEQPG